MSDTVLPTATTVFEVRVFRLDGFVNLAQDEFLLRGVENGFSDQADVRLLRFLFISSGRSVAGASVAVQEGSLVVQAEKCSCEGFSLSEMKKCWVDG